MRRKRDEGPGHEGSAAGGGRSTASAMITPLDIQQKEFQVSRLGGYRMREVDEFLDQLTDAMTAVLAENERLRAGASSSPIVGSPDLDEVSRQADEIIQRARDEAARIVAEARTRSSSTPGGAPGAVTAAEREAVDAFLARERAFLQRLAALVQEHADGVKSMAKDVRRRSAPGSTGKPLVATAPDEEAASTSAQAPASDVSEPPEAGDGQADADDGDAPETEASADPDATRPMDRVTASDDAEEDGEETIVVAEAEAERSRASARSRREDDRDETLRELFWGEEG